MDEMQPHDGSHLFLVRLWVEKRRDEQDQWRGKVQHVVTGRAGFFDDWASLVGLLTSMGLDRAGAQPEPHPE